MSECKLLIDKHCLVCFEVQTTNPILCREIEFVKDNFCGKVLCEEQDDAHASIAPDAIVYVCGNIANFLKNYGHLAPTQTIKIIKELSYNHHFEDAELVTVCEVPLNTHGVGVYFRKFLTDGTDYFSELKNAHQFQALTESNKPGTSYRKGIYLSHVEKMDDGTTSFNLLRCSTNLDGPTDSFKTIDEHIIQKVNEAATMFFDNPALLNHVLAQIYENSKVVTENSTKEKKARIKSHSDKTKDMPSNGLIAFTTFYSKDKPLFNMSKKSTNIVEFNEGFLTKLRFRLKDCVKNSNMTKEFTVALLPNSVFLIPLSTNRLYIHEIVPPNQPVDKIPTRLGYVIRCSKTIAVHKDDNMYIKEGDVYTKLEEPTEESMANLKDLYWEENSTDKIVDYGNIYFSLNKGDYAQPSM